MENEKSKQCVICGRGEGLFDPGELTNEDERNNLTLNDIQLGYCRDCD